MLRYCWALKMEAACFQVGHTSTKLHGVRAQATVAACHGTGQFMAVFHVWFTACGHSTHVGGRPWMAVDGRGWPCHVANDTRAWGALAPTRWHHSGQDSFALTAKQIAVCLTKHHAKTWCGGCLTTLPVPRVSDDGMRSELERI